MHNFKKILGVILAVIIIVLTIIPTTYADEAPSIVYSEHLTNEYTYDITNASIAWVKQAKGALIWVTETDTREDDKIIAQAIAVDPSLANAVDTFTVLRGINTAETPNTNGSKALITIVENNNTITFNIEGKYSHFVLGSNATTNEDVETTVIIPETPEVTEEEVVNIRIDAPRKMAVAFADGTIYYGGEMKEVIVGAEYLFRMCAVNWNNGVYDENSNGLAGTVVYRMIALHHKDYINYAFAARDNAERYIVKGIDIIDNETKTIYVNCDATDAHLETDVNSFFMAYRFHFTSSDYNKKTQIEGVIDSPIESLSVNLPLGTTVTCNAYDGNTQLGTDYVFITNNSGEGIYEDEFLTSVNDYTWIY